MLYFTKYAEQKFEILNKYKIFITKEQVEDVVNRPAEIKKKGKYFFAELDNIKVVYQKQKDITKIITFYPIKK